MTMKWSPGCLCCDGVAGNKFTASGSSAVVWYKPPCSVGNRIGIDVTIENLSNQTDYNGAPFDFNCGTCVRTYSNINGTYYVPAPLDISVSSTSTVVFGQWYTGDNSCVGPQGGPCTPPATYSYFLLEADWYCDETNGLSLLGPFGCSLWFCDADGNKASDRSGYTQTAASTWSVQYSPTPDNCDLRPSTCCNVGCATGSSDPDARLKFEYVTT